MLAFTALDSIIKIPLLIILVTFRFTVIGRRSLKSFNAATSPALPPQNNPDAAMMDFDDIDHDLADYSDIENSYFENSSPFHADDPDSNPSPYSNQAYPFGSFLDDDVSQLQTNESVSYFSTISRADTSPRAYKIDSTTTSTNSPSSCPLIRLGSRIPSLPTPNTIQSPTSINSNGSNVVCPSASPLAADVLPIRQDTAVNSACRSCNTRNTHPMTALGPPSNTSTLHEPQSQSSQYNYPTNPSSTITRAPDPAPQPDISTFEWTDLPTPPKSTAGSDRMGFQGGYHDSGSRAPIKSNRTTIIMEDAKPEVILDVMRVVVSSNTKVRIETD